MIKKWVHTALVLVVGLCSCSTISQIPDSSHIYKRELALNVNKISCTGTCVVPISGSYQIHVEASQIDYLSLETCHRKVTAEDVGSQWDYTYIPQSLEQDCPVEIVTLDKKKARNGYGFIDFMSPTYNLTATLSCDDWASKLSGVAICQSKLGLNQSITFESPVVSHPDANCPMDIPKDGMNFVFKLNRGLCTYVFGNKAGFFKLTTIGTDDIILEHL